MLEQYCSFIPDIEISTKSTYFTPSKVRNEIFPVILQGRPAGVVYREVIDNALIVKFKVKIGLKRTKHHQVQM